jgi:ribosomal protein L11 methyltransferase
VNWLSVRVRPGPSPDAALAALFSLGSEGVHESGAELVTHFPEDADGAAIEAGVRAADPAAEVTFTLVPAIDWSEECPLAIVPPWLTGGRDLAKTIVIEPEMAFGTGEHQTTRGVVRLLPDVIRPGDRVADLGAGSAVLAIAAAKLGAAHVTAIEIDHDAIANAEENVARNDVGDRVTVLEGDAGVLLPLVAPVRVVLANIISSVLTIMLPTIAESLTADGEAILSGIFVEERSDMLGVLDSGGWRLVGEDVEGMWWSARIARR